MAAGSRVPFEYFFIDRIRPIGDPIATIGASVVYGVVEDSENNRYRYVGLAQRDRKGHLDVLSLGRNEWLVKPDLVYELYHPTEWRSQ